MMLSRDGITGLVCLAISLGLFALTFELPPPAVVSIGPAFYPRIVLSLLALLSAILIVLDFSALRRARAAVAEMPSTSGSPPPNYRLVLATFVEFGIYIALLPPLGFRIATFLFVLALQATLEWPRTIKSWIIAVVVAIATSIVCYLVFENYLSVLLPRGTWSGL